MRALLLTCLLVACTAHAENWVYTKDKSGIYDLDTIVRKGAFSEIDVSEVGRVRFDCANKGWMLLDNGRGAPGNWNKVTTTAGSETLVAACSKSWEFWKR